MEHDSSDGKQLTMTWSRFTRICYRFLLVLVSPLVGFAIASFSCIKIVLKCLNDEDDDDDDGCCFHNIKYVDKLVESKYTVESLFTVL